MNPAQGLLAWFDCGCLGKVTLGLQACGLISSNVYLGLHVAACQLALVLFGSQTSTSCHACKAWQLAGLQGLLIARCANVQRAVPGSIALRQEPCQVPTQYLAMLTVR